jgi:class 3 adenylate cyclase
MHAPVTRYARSGDLSIAYQVIGKQPRDLVLVPGFVSHLEWAWQEPGLARFLERLASFRRLITFDKRGTGMSDPVGEPPTYEERMDDLRAVMDASGSAMADIFGVSEGGALAALFAAAHPERATALVLYGTWARLPQAPDYPEGYPLYRLDRHLNLVEEHWGEPGSLRFWAPDCVGDTRLAEWFGALQRLGASPSMAHKLLSSYLGVDVRRVLSAITAPTLVLHRRGDTEVPVSLGQYLAQHIEGARLVELDGRDHLFFVGDADAILDETEEFLTGTRRASDPARRLATVMFADVVGSTGLAGQLGDRRWTEVLASFTELATREIARFGGRVVKTIGDGVLAEFDGPGRAISATTGLRNAVADLGIGIRAGLHAGEVEVLGDDIGGIAVHTAARIVTAADPGEVLVSSTVRELVAGSGLRFRDRGMHSLKGLPEPWQLFAVE